MISILRGHRLDLRQQLAALLGESVESKSDPNFLEFGGWKRSKSRLYTIDASKPENGWKLSAKGQAGD